MVTAIIVVAVIVLDYISKQVITSRIMLYDSISILPFLNIVHVENKGAAFSLFTNLGNTFFIVVAFIAIIVLLIYLARIPKGLESISLSMILGGAAGNLIDRIRIGKVIDFIDIYVGRWHWPAFNVADSALTIGIILFIWSTIVSQKHANDIG